MLLLITLSCAPVDHVLVVTPQGVLLVAPETLVVSRDDECTSYEITLEGQGELTGLLWDPVVGDPGDVVLPQIDSLVVEQSAVVSFDFCPSGDEPVSGLIHLAFTGQDRTALWVEEDNT